MIAAPDLKAALDRFHGSETFTYLDFPYHNCLLTEGVRYLADNAACYWLVTDILAWQLQPKVKNEDFQVWYLERQGDGWLLRCEDGDYNPIVQQRYEMTTFPLDSIKLFACRNEMGGVTLMLPSEY